MQYVVALLPMVVTGAVVVAVIAYLFHTQLQKKDAEDVDDPEIEGEIDAEIEAADRPAPGGETKS